VALAGSSLWIGRHSRVFTRPAARRRVFPAVRRWSCGSARTPPLACSRRGRCRTGEKGLSWLLSASRGANSSQWLMLSSWRRACTARSTLSRISAWRCSGRPGPVGQPFSQMRIGISDSMPGLRAPRAGSAQGGGLERDSQLARDHGGDAGPLFLVRALHVHPAYVGVLLALGAVGGVGAGLASTTLARRSCPLLVPISGYERSKNGRDGGTRTRDPLTPRNAPVSLSPGHICISAGDAVHMRAGPSHGAR
jgi:hypothetical protein